MGYVYEKLEGALDGHEEQYQSLKEKYDSFLEEYEEKWEEYNEKFSEAQALSKKVELEEEKLEQFVSEAYDKEISRKIGELAGHSHELAEKYHKELLQIQEDEGKEARKKVVYQEQEFPYFPPDPSIESIKTQLYHQIERTIERLEEESNEAEESYDETEESDDDNLEG